MSATKLAELLQRLRDQVDRLLHSEQTRAGYADRGILRDLEQTFRDLERVEAAGRE